MHQGRGFTGSGQYSAVEKNHCGKATTTVHQGMRVYRFRTVFCCEKKSLWQGYQDSAAGTRVYRFRTVFCCEKNHCGKATRTLQPRTRVLQVEDSIPCCEKNLHCSNTLPATLQPGTRVSQVQDILPCTVGKQPLQGKATLQCLSGQGQAGQYSAVEKHHCSIWLPAQCSKDNRQ